MEDKKISESVKLLYKGAKMLPYHCPECNSPLFKKDDKMFCPYCKKEAVFEKDVENTIMGAEVIPEASTTKIENRENQALGMNHKSILEEKLNYVLEYMKKAKTIDEIERLTNLADKLVTLIEKIGKS
ncbi:putative Zn-finger containing protein [Archaeoglobus sulfaticallidus PM70-1]|uniref:Putative Zn-finger containing protein n=1 Tax=Archaeoglobus sulfaticallidus PM70-1 TaxID=387631 RepID=N0BMH2_9EURY|nr:Sjogren's syndrome/scleroderma autoantigen 1 family protein [Archaeoglobus sulfaticallidus]AGK61831.1 putative Zn-finger containing protein [Archaeoglobus sulfaticallidus PM70-1]